MIIKEYRIVLPLTVDEYQVAQLYSVAQVSKDETGGGEGIEVLSNESFTRSSGVQPTSPLLNGRFDQGQYTHKIFYVKSKIPRYIAWLAPKGSLEIHEEAWNAFPYCRTVITNPDFMKKNFIIKIESMHLSDRGETENAHGLDEVTLAKREVVHIDIANDPVYHHDYKEEEDPKTYMSQKTGRGLLVDPDWPRTVTPVMTCYKLVTAEFIWWGLQGRVETAIHKGEKRLFTKFHRQLFCWTDQWYGLTMVDIRHIEDTTKTELEEQIRLGAIRGMRAGSESL